MIKITLQIHLGMIHYIAHGKHEIQFLHNISHYYNNEFVFHMHTFIILGLIFNILNTTIH
jgi:hypothetical protein